MDTIGSSVQTAELVLWKTHDTYIHQYVTKQKYKTLILFSIMVNYRFAFELGVALTIEDGLEKRVQQTFIIDFYNIQRTK